MKHNFDIYLFNPEIPQNAGNVARTCSATNTTLYLVKPLGFHLNDQKLKRAGLDYWESLQLALLNRSEFEEKLKANEKPHYFFTSKTTRSFWDVDLSDGASLIFGNETKGLPEEYYTLWKDHLVTIPMSPEARCLNLSNAVSIALYEGLRQSTFANYKPI